MNIQGKLIETERLYEQKKAERNSHIEVAEECLTEMTKLQGAYRLLQDIEKEEMKQADTKKTKKKSDVTEAIPAEGKQ